MSPSRPAAGTSLRRAQQSSHDIEIRHLTTHAEREMCVEFQRMIWGPEFADAVPASLVSATQKAGGLAAGAFDGLERLVGFVYGIPAWMGGRVSHWSHMLGVARSQRGRGVGRRLKFFQRRFLLDAGVEEMWWTFDPLVAGNAYFNCSVLGVTIEAYVKDMYAETGSGLHSIGTDRVIARWALTAEKTPEEEGAENAAWDAPVLNPDLAIPTKIHPDGEQPPERIRIRIPRNVFRAHRIDPSATGTWRLVTRSAFELAQAEGYRVVGFSRSKDSPDGYYLLARGDGQEG